MRKFLYQIMPGLMLAGAVTLSAIHYLVKPKRATLIEPGGQFMRIIEKDSGFHPGVPSPMPVLLVKKNAHDTASVPLGLKLLNIDVKVLGNIATTTLEMSFYNDVDRELEGQFCFPLGEGQSLHRFAMEVSGHMREGVVVEKEKGRVVFESTIRRKIDPGLLEWTQGNNFRARVFPIPAKGYKKILVAFDQELMNVQEGYVFWHPLQFSQKLEKFSARVEVFKPGTSPQNMTYDSVSGEKLRFERSSNGNWLAETSKENYIADHPILFNIPAPGSAGHVFLENIPGTSDSRFYADVMPERYRSEKPKPSCIGVLWDASASAAKRDTAREIQVLERYIKSLGQVKVKLVVFRNEAEPEKLFDISNGNSAELIQYLRQQPCDGGTSLGCLYLRKYLCDEFILCSDGLSNFGEEDIHLSGVPVQVLCASAEADHSRLKYIAQASNGQFVNVMLMPPNEVAGRLSSQPYRFMGLEYDKKVMSEVYPSLPCDFNSSFAISGISSDKNAEVTLLFGSGATVNQRIKVKLSPIREQSSGMVHRLWAVKKINELDLQFDRNKEQITALGKEYSVVTRNTSLIVLDRIEDYVTHRIEPKEEDLKKEYLALVSKEGRSISIDREEHMKQVVEQYKARLAWWNTRYIIPEKEKPAPPVIREPQEETSVHDTTAVTIGMAESGGAMDGSKMDTDLDRSTMTYNWDFGDNGRNANRYLFSAPAMGGHYSFSTSDHLAQSVQSWNGNITSGTFTIRADENQAARGADIALNNWKPDAAYMKTLEKAGKEQVYTSYLGLRSKWASTPSFFLDAADVMLRKGQKELALRVLSNIAELELENHQLLRVLAHRLQQLGYTDLAIGIFEDVLEIRGEEPQSYRDLGLAYAANGKYQQAVDVLCKVVNRQWDGRFPELESMVAGEINEIISKSKVTLNLDSFDTRLRTAMPVDMRILIGWDSDNCDMDLWVTDPDGVVCMYSNPNTPTGGRISRDFTGGYGPEEFMVKKALPGKYKVEVNYFGSSQTTLAGPTTVQATLITNYGRASEKRQHITLRLKENKEVVYIGELAFK